VLFLAALRALAANAYIGRCAWFQAKPQNPKSGLLALAPCDASTPASAHLGPQLKRSQSKTPRRAFHFSWRGRFLFWHFTEPIFQEEPLVVWRKGHPPAAKELQQGHGRGLGLGWSSSQAAGRRTTASQMRAACTSYSYWIYCNYFVQIAPGARSAGGAATSKLHPNPVLCILCAR
jgi:hypothetical protein